MSYEVLPHKDATSRERDLLRALQCILNLSENDCEHYVLKCDEIALEAITRYEAQS
jgi:hypothetical protein